jgi:hypothetical protein
MMLEDILEREKLIEKEHSKIFRKWLIIVIVASLVINALLIFLSDDPSSAFIPCLVIGGLLSIVINLAYNFECRKVRNEIRSNYYKES